MSLLNDQYDKIMREYDARRMEESYRLHRRTEDIYSAIPAIRELDNSIAAESVKAGKLAILGDNSELSQLRTRLDEFTAEKRRLLTEAGYPEDYLDTHFTCPLCRDTGYIGQEYCSCFRTAVSELIYDESTLSDILQDENFSTFSYDVYSDRPEDFDRDLGCTPRENMTQVVQKMKKFVSTFDSSYVNILIYGETGLGKTFLTNCIAKELLDTAHTVRYFTSYTLFAMLEDHKFRYNEYEKNYSGQFETIFECDLLIIDDLGSENANSFTVSNIYSIINERHLRKKATVISTNLTPGALEQIYGQRIYSRITSNYEFIKLIGQDIRTFQ